MISRESGVWLCGDRMRVGHFYVHDQARSVCKDWGRPRETSPEDFGECSRCNRKLEPPKPPVVEPITMRDLFVIGQLTDGSLHMVVLEPGERGMIKDLLRQMHEGPIKIGVDAVTLDIYYRESSEDDE